jgi:hypothetical protein
MLTPTTAKTAATTTKRRIVFAVSGFLGGSLSTGTGGAAGSEGCAGITDAEGGSGGGVFLLPGGRDAAGRGCCGRSVSCTCLSASPSTWMVPPGSRFFGSSCDTLAE